VSAGPDSADARAGAIDQSLHIDVVDTVEGFDRLRDVWDRLLLGATWHTPFHSFEWCRLACEHLVPARTRLCILTARDRGGELCGLAPLYVSPASRLRPATLRSLSTEVGDYGGFLLRPDGAELVCRALLDWLLCSREGWDSIDLTGLPAGSPLVALAHSGAIRGIRFEAIDACHRISLPSSPEAYLRGLGRKTRENVRRQRRRLEREHEAAFSSVTDADELSGALDQFITMQRERFAAMHYRGFFKTPRRERFFRDIASALLKRGWLDLHCLRIDGVLAAAQFGMELHGTRFNYQIAMDVRHASHGPGTLVMLSSIEAAISRGVTCYDLLRGARGYKRTLGAEEHSRFVLGWTRRPAVDWLQRWRARGLKRLESVALLRRLAFPLVSRGNRD
jgi:CelD/BcsL family acetyltransferase involved in cellulose biosynthesis